MVINVNFSVHYLIIMYDMEIRVIILLHTCTQYLALQHDNDSNILFNSSLLLSHKIYRKYVLFSSAMSCNTALYGVQMCIVL